MLLVSQLMTEEFSTDALIVNCSHNCIYLHEQRIVLQPKVIELLILLCAANGETLSKQSLTEQLWPDTVVGPDSLANCMARLRKALQEDAKTPHYIETVHRKGYRWCKPVSLSTGVQHNNSLWYKSKYSLMCVAAISLVISWLAYDANSKSPLPPFPYTDMAIKKLDNGGYEVNVGIEGELTQGKKAAMLEEIKRITGEQNSGMEFTVDPMLKDCEEQNKGQTKQQMCKQK